MKLDINWPYTKIIEFDEIHIFALEGFYLKLFRGQNIPYNNHICFKRIFWTTFTGSYLWKPPLKLFLGVVSLRKLPLKVFSIKRLKEMVLMLLPTIADM